MNKLERFYSSSKETQNISYVLAKEEIYSKWIGSGKVILDIGCNDGRADVPLIEKGNTVYGVDMVEEAAEVARSRGVKALRMDITKDPLPFQDNFFDVIIAGDIIEHIFDTDDFMRKISAKLKMNGTLILSTPNLASLGRRLLLLFGRNPFCEYSLEDEIGGARPVGHIRYFVKKDLVGFLEKHGFKVESIISDAFNLGVISSRFLGALFPSLGCRFILRATKAKDKFKNRW